MVGRKQYDEDQAIHAAMLTFWQSGYEGTSISALESAMGLSKSSIYNAYGSKRQLYAQALNHFGKHYGETLLKDLAHPQFTVAIRQFFDRLLHRFENDYEPMGCFATKAGLEVGSSDAPAAEVVCAGLKLLREAFQTRIEQAIQDGQLPGDTDCQKISAVLVSQTRGIAVLNLGTGDVRMAKQSVEGLLQLLDSRTGAERGRS